MTFWHPLRADNSQHTECIPIRIFKMIDISNALQERIRLALDQADIKMWELYRVDNCQCEGPPLGVPDKDSASNPVSNALQLQ